MSKFSNEEGYIGRGDNKKFRDFAKTRVSNALLHIKRISNLSNTQNYKYKESEVKQIFKALRDEISLSEQKFYKHVKNQNDDDGGFQFK